MKSLYYILFILAGAFFFVSCDKHEAEPPVICPVESDTCNRTILVYMLGSNSLGSYVESNIAAMKKAVERGESNNGNLLLYIDRYNEMPTLEQISLRDGIYNRTVVKTYENDSSATVEVMEDVCADVKSLYPSDSYGLILWSHASGWYPYKSSVSYRSSRSFGDDEGMAMNIDELAEAIPDSLFDFILCDACYMGTVEVPYALRKDCRYYIGSPASVMGDGFPYEKIISSLYSCEKPIPHNLIEVCESYMTYYRNYDDPYATISLVDVAELEPLARAVRLALGDSVVVKPSAIQQFSKEKTSRVSYQNMFFDLSHFLETTTPDALPYSIYTDCLARAILYADATDYYLSRVSGWWNKYRIDCYCGLAAYIPGSSTDEGVDFYYHTLEWYNDVYEGIGIEIKK